jgi:WD40 repeat protein
MSIEPLRRFHPLEYFHALRPEMHRQRFGPREQRYGLGRQWTVVLIVFLLGLYRANSARAQADIRDFKKPILVAETGGHHAPVRALVWQDARTLLSGGEDKVVKVWDFPEGEGGHLARSIRPMIWRGAAGNIYALAVTPKPDNQGQSLLAVAGYGIESQRGDITIFRVPGLERIPTGEVVARLIPPLNNDPQVIAHRNTVPALAFDPTGRILASGDSDGKVILWDVPSFRPLRVLPGHTRAIRTLAFSPDGQRLATAGQDGSLRVWDVNQGGQVDGRAGNPQNPDPINIVAYSPDGQFIVIGLEGGALIRFDSRSLTQVPAIRLPPAREGQGPIESLTFHPDGRLAVSIRSDKADTSVARAIPCDLELRAMPAGNIVHQRRIPGWVRSLAFSPDGNRLAYSGGAAQEISIQDTADLARQPQELKGEGSTPYDLGFMADSQTIGFTREAINPANPPQIYMGFDLGKRQRRNLARGELQRAVTEHQGWRIEGSIDQYRLELVNADGRRLPLLLDRATDRLWWSSTFIPAGPGHPRPTVAIGMETGIVVFDLETRQRVHVFTGHTAPVVSLAPSPDGRWLASSSLDQTVMLYPLRGCDTLPGLGATFQQGANGDWAVQEIVPRSFAAAMGLHVGDVITVAGIGRQIYAKPETIAAFVARRWFPPQVPNPEELAKFTTLVDKESPGVTIGIFVRRRIFLPQFGGFFNLEFPQAFPSTKRDNPALTLFLGVNKEWVIWTPQGYYDTSIAGDSRFLGWHSNPPHDSVRPSDFVPIVAYARTMNRPEILDQLWRLGDPNVVALPAGTAPVVTVIENQLPKILFGSIEGGIRLPAPGVLWAVAVPNPKLKVKIVAEGNSRIDDRRIILDERPIPTAKLANPVSEQTEELPVELTPNRRVRLAVIATNVNGGRRTETIDLVYLPPPAPPPPPPPPPRLFVVSIGSDQFAHPQLSPVKYADKDAEGLAEFLADHLVSTDGAKTKVKNSVVLSGSTASAKSVREKFDHLDKFLKEKQFRQGDVVAVVIALHVLECNGGSVIATADAQAGNPPAPTVSTREISDLLGQLADYGCRVVLFLDGVHKVQEPLSSEIKPWVRELFLEKRVITFVASEDKPSGADDRAQHGYFALGILQAFQGAGPAGTPQNREAPYTLDQFDKAVRDTVSKLSARDQDASCHIPQEVPERTLFARP